MSKSSHAIERVNRHRAPAGNGLRDAGISAVADRDLDSAGDAAEYVMISLASTVLPVSGWSYCLLRMQRGKISRCG
jgi:hypothetical protein